MGHRGWGSRSRRGLGYWSGSNRRLGSGGFGRCSIAIANCDVGLPDFDLVAYLDEYFGNGSASGAKDLEGSLIGLDFHEGLVFLDQIPLGHLDGVNLDDLNIFLQGWQLMFSRHRYLRVKFFDW